MMKLEIDAGRNLAKAFLERCVPSGERRRRREHCKAQRNGEGATTSRHSAREARTEHLPGRAAKRLS